MYVLKFAVRSLIAGCGAYPFDVLLISPVNFNIRSNIGDEQELSIESQAEGAA